MREHMGLFRGKRIDNGEWVEGNLLIFKRYSTDIDHYYILPIGTIYGYDDLLLMAWEVDPDTVGECTGLRDKNGKLVFEGDILDCKGGMYERCKVIFNEFCSAFQLMCKDGFSDFFLCSINHAHMVVIGNVHDNPELLKGGEGDG